jgi:hypothetical protein
MHTLASCTLLLIALAGSLFLTACNKRDDASPTDDIATAEDQSEANIENAISTEAVQAAAPADPETRNSPYLTTDEQFRAKFGSCATRTYDYENRLLTIDFGPTNCLCPDGRYRRGKILVQFMTATLTRRAGATVTRQNYYVNDNHHTATRIFIDLGNGSFSVDVPSASIIRANNGGTHSWTAHWEFQRTAGYGTPQVADDAYSVTGYSNGTNRRNVSYTSTIQTPLIKRGDCPKYYVAGILNISNTNGKTMTLNYDPSGTQSCDNTALVTINGRTRTIMLR